MLSEAVQPGTRIDAALWKRFRQDIKARRGSVRGHLRTELETAIRQYLDGEAAESFASVDERLSRIEAAIGVAEADGGADAVPAATHAHASSEKPPPNAPTNKKVEYLAERIREDHGCEPQEIPESKIIQTVKSEYSFKRKTAKRYVETLIDHFGLREHPIADGLLVTTERYQELYKKHRES